MREERGNVCWPPEPVLMGVPDSSFVADRQLMAALGAAARQHGAAILRVHPGPESVSLRALAIIRLKCTFRHGLSSLAHNSSCVDAHL
jgi:hypothetical protein